LQKNFIMKINETQSIKNINTITKGMQVDVNLNNNNEALMFVSDRFLTIDKPDPPSELNHFSIIPNVFKILNNEDVKVRQYDIICSGNLFTSSYRTFKNFYRLNSFTIEKIKIVGTDIANKQFQIRIIKIDEQDMSYSETVIDSKFVTSSNNYRNDIVEIEKTIKVDKYTAIGIIFASNQDDLYSFLFDVHSVS